MQCTGRLWAIHLNSGATEYACESHLLVALDALTDDDTPVGHAPCSDTEHDCAFC